METIGFYQENGVYLTRQETKNIIRLNREENKFRATIGVNANCTNETAASIDLLLKKENVYLRDEKGIAKKIGLNHYFGEDFTIPLLAINERYTDNGPKGRNILSILSGLDIRWVKLAVPQDSEGAVHLYDIGYRPRRKAPNLVSMRLSCIQRDENQLEPDSHRVYLKEQVFPRLGSHRLLVDETLL